MHGMFRSNGGCGYVKKPDFLMMRGLSNEVFDPKTALLVKKTLKVSFSKWLESEYHLSGDIFESIQVLVFLNR